MKKLVLAISAVAPALMAQDPSAGNAPSFAAEWRVTGIIRQGNHAEASMEKAGMRARFVREGDQLPGDVTVVLVDYQNRRVTLAKGVETAILQPASTMAPPPPPPKGYGIPQLLSANQGGQTGPWPNPPPKPTAMRDRTGRWHIVLPNGHSEDMHAYAQKYGGVRGATEYLINHLKSPHSPEREDYHKQQLEALQQMQAAGIR